MKAVEVRSYRHTRAIIQISIMLRFFMLGLLLQPSLFAQNSPLQPSPAQASPLTTPLFLADQKLESTRPVGLSRDGQLVFESQSGRVELSGTSIVRWNAWRPPRNETALQLLDGSWIVGRPTWLEAQRLRLESDWLEPVVLNLDDVRALINVPPLGKANWLALQEQLESHRGSQDATWNLSSEKTEGLLTSELEDNPIAGGAPQRIRWKLETSDRQAIALESKNLRAIAFSPVLRPAIVRSEKGFELGLADGSLLRVKRLAVSSDGRVTISLNAGLELRALDDPESFVSSIQCVFGTPSGVLWLNEQTPALYRHVDPNSRLQWQLGNNRDLDGNPLIVRGDIARHSLVLHAPAQVTYRLGGDATKFIAECLVTPPTGLSESRLGSARFKVILAKDGKLSEAFASPVVSFSSAPIPVSVDIRGAQLVTLVVEEADVGSLGDHCVWRDARVLAQPPE